MQIEPGDINYDQITDDDIHEMEERRIEALNKAHIDEQEVLRTATQNLNSWSNYFADNITLGKADLEFCVHEQWNSAELNEFQRLKKTAQTFNKIYDPVKKILGEQRKNRPDLMVRSLNGKCSQEQLSIRTDLVRTIAYQSQTDLVYQTAFKSSLLTGMGAFQVGLDYENNRSFNKIIKYGIIPDATRCCWDPAALLPHKGDGNFCSRNFTMTRAEFFATYPYIQNPVPFADPYMLIDFQYNIRNTICIEDVYVKEWYPLSIIHLSNGMSVTEDEWEEAQKIYQKQLDIVKGSIVSNIIEEGMPHIVGRRYTQDYKLMHYRMLRDKIIEFSEFPCKQLPIIFVDGDSYYKDGHQYTKSFIHESIDAQRSLNYFNSEITSEIKNRRREQWLGTPENISGYEQIWRNPEVQIGLLMARPDPKTGQMPIKQSPWEVSQALMQNAQRATQDIKEITGFSEQEVINSRDMSGKARRERKLEGGLAAYIYFDNLNASIAQGGRIVNELLSYVVGKDERYLTIAKPDGKTSSVIFNHKQKDGSVKNVLEDGEFDIEINAGPSFTVQKDIALEFLQQTLQANPQAFNLVADIWASNLDVEFMPQLVERFKTLVPPAILAKENGTPPPPPQPNPEQMMAQHQMMMQQKEMQNKQAEISLKAQQLKMDQQQHQLDAERLKNEMIEILGKMQNDQDKHILEKSKFMANLTQIAMKDRNEHQERQIDLHKAHLNHADKVDN